MSDTTNNNPDSTKHHFGWRELLVGFGVLASWVGFFFFITGVAWSLIFVPWLLVAAMGLGAILFGIASKKADDGSRKDRYCGALCWGSILACLLCVFLAQTIGKARRSAEAKVREIVESVNKQFADELGLPTVNCWLPCIEKEKQLQEVSVARPEDLQKVRHILVDLETTAKESRESLNQGLIKWRVAPTQSRDDMRSRIVNLADRNVELFDEYIAGCRDLREWSYSAQALAKSTSSGEMVIETIVRGMNGDPLGTYNEWRGKHDDQSIALMRLCDRWDQVFTKRKAIIRDVVRLAEQDKTQRELPSRP